MATKETHEHHDHEHHDHEHAGKKIAERAAHKLKTEDAPATPAADTGDVATPQDGCSGPNGCGGK